MNAVLYAMSFFCNSSGPTYTDTQINKTFYNTTTYGPISDVVGGYVLTTDGTVYALQNKRIVNILNSSLVQ